MPRGVYERKPRTPQPQQPGATPPQKRKQEPAAGAQPTGNFIDAMTADTRLVVIGRSPEPEIYSEAQTQEIATLLANHFEA